MENVRLAVNDLNKAFSAPVLKHLSLLIAPGEIHAIVGENGAGKSTLVNILSGNLQRDSGEIFLDGEPYEPAGPAEGFTAGISSAAQELSTIGTLSVAENIALRRLPHRHSVIQREELHREACKMLALVGLAGISPDWPAERLSVAERQLLELAKALSTESRLLILDEPTAALTGPQAERIHEIIAAVAATGTAVIYISHRLDDVLDVSDVVSVLRDGEVVITAPADSLTVEDMIVHMSGQAHQQCAEDKETRQAGTPVLDVDGVITRDLPHAISFTCHRGEIIGIAGLAGSGRSELLQALFGLAQLVAGEVRCCTKIGNFTIRSAGHAVKNGMGYLGEDRQSMGIFAGQSVLTNMMLPGESVEASVFSLISRELERSAAADLMRKLAIRCSGPEQDISQLSGGNQQKALIARWLHRDADILLLDEPTRGVDVATKSAIYALLSELQGRQKTIVIVSSEIEELMTLCDRILVLSERKLVKIFGRGEWSETAILAAAFQELTDARDHTAKNTDASAGEKRL